MDVTTCKVMRAETPEAVAAARGAAKRGAVPVPVYLDEWSELHAPVLGSKLAVIMPINQAGVANGRCLQNKCSVDCVAAGL